jgi:hypothetical protein
MVRVISAHHFVAQDVAACQAEPVCSTVAEQWLLLSTQLHQVEMRDLSAAARFSHILHTVDLVVEMLYSPVG